MVHEKPWYEDKNKVLELAEFMVDTEEITTARELLDYFKNPSKYTEVWKLYEEEIGERSKSSNEKPSSLPIFAALAIIPP